MNEPLKGNLPGQTALEEALSRTDLSWEAKGIYAWMLAHPESLTWPKYKIRESVNAEGRYLGTSAFQRITKELESAGVYAKAKSALARQEVA